MEEKKRRGLKEMKVKGPPQYILGLKKTSLAVSFLLKPITLFGLKEKLSHHFRVFLPKLHPHTYTHDKIAVLISLLLQVVILNPLLYI